MNAVVIEGESEVVPVIRDGDSRPHSDESWRSKVGPGLLIVASAIWLSSLIGVDLREMTDVGLVSVLPSRFFVACALLTVGFLFTIEFRADHGVLVGGYLVVLSAIAHATPALLYGAVGNWWTYGHLGVVDYIRRTGGVDPDAEFLQIHHGWPGLFSASALFSDLTGLAPSTLAMWAPFAFSLVSLLALSILYRSFVVDRRVRMLALWMFVIANWVGQEYFSPQGFTTVLYLALLAIALPSSLRSPWNDADDSPDVDGDLRPAQRSSIVVASIVVAIVMSHQLTSTMVVVTFGVVALAGVARTTWIVVTTLGATTVWMFGPALTYVSSNPRAAADAFGSPTERSDTAPLDSEIVSVGHAIVLTAGRFLTAMLIVLAVLGIVAMWHRSRHAGLLLALIVAPIVLAFTDSAGEVIFRSYLFAVPWIALAAAAALVAVVDGRPFPARFAAHATVISLLLLAFVIAGFGRERSNYFTPEEVDLATWLSEVAPPNSLLIEGSKNYPGSARNYERFAYRAMSREPRASLIRIDADPEAVLYEWMTDDRHSSSFFVVTRSMLDDQHGVPTMPDGLLERASTALRASDRFAVVYANRDGVVFAARQGRA